MVSLNHPNIFINGKTILISVRFMKKYRCICGYVYDPVKGEPKKGIKPGAPFNELPDDYLCAACGLSKNKFELIE